MHVRNLYADGIADVDTVVCFTLRHRFEVAPLRPGDVRFQDLLMQYVGTPRVGRSTGGALWLALHVVVSMGVMESRSCLILTCAQY